MIHWIFIRGLPYKGVGSNHVTLPCCLTSANDLHHPHCRFKEKQMKVGGKDTHRGRGERQEWTIKRVRRAQRTKEQ